MGVISRRQTAAPVTPEPIGAAADGSDLFTELYLEALLLVAPGRVNDLSVQLIGRGGLPDDEVAALLVAAEAAMFAMDLAASTPSANGSTAFDRLARSRRNAKPEEAAAIEALRHSRFRLLQVETAAPDGRARLRDLATGESLDVERPALRQGCEGLALVGRLARLADGGFRFVGPVTPLDAVALAVANGFIRPGGRGLSALRCAEAVYRHVLRHGTLEIPGVNRPPEGFFEADDFPIDPSDSELDALAFAWAELPEGAAPPLEDVQVVRGHCDINSIIDALVSATMATDWEREKLAEAYARIVLVQLETLRLRESTGSSLLRPDNVAAAIEHAIAAGKVPRQVRTLFDDLRRRAGAAPPRNGSREDGELDRLIQRIRALRAKTVEQGCTEQEALAAAEKVAELLDRHGLTLSELELRRQTCEGVGIDTDRRRLSPIDDCVPAIAAFFDCRVWSERTTAGALRYIFFGLPADVEAAHYLYDLVDRAFATETARFQAGDIYSRTGSGHRRRASNSFQLGLARGIRTKLEDLRQAREAALRSGSGRDLVPIKTAIVEEELAKLGLNLRARSRATRKTILVDAFDAGHEAGKRFDYRPGLEAD
jgi:hypothetical protein